jgi:hypothetical protein
MTAGGEAGTREPNPTVFQKTLALDDFYGPAEHC